MKYSIFVDGVRKYDTNSLIDANKKFAELKKRCRVFGFDCELELYDRTQNKVLSIEYIF